MSIDPTQHDLLETLKGHLSGAIDTLSLIQDTHETTSTKTPGEVLLFEKPIYALFINGKSRKASEAEVQTINPENYALYLNVTSGLLGIHLPSQASQLQTVQQAGIDGVQDILGVMLENPHLNFGNVNIGLFLPHRVEMTPDAFRKAMAKIRYAIQNGNKEGLLLLHFDRSHFSISESGHAWRISMDVGDLCFIKFLSLPKRFRRQGRR
jgi:hypothetical protein